MATTPPAKFAATAAYFEAKSKKNRHSDDRRQELADAARFYSALATITPTFPHGYKEPATDIGFASRLNKRAEECRAMAAATRDQECRAKLLRLAQTYERVSSGPAVAAE